MSKMTERQAEIRKMYADLDPTRSELLDMLTGALIGIENFSSLPMAEQGVKVLLRRRREREAEARGNADQASA